MVEETLRFQDKDVVEKEMTPSVQSQPHQRSQSMKEQHYSATTHKVQDKDKERPNHVELHRMTTP